MISKGIFNVIGGWQGDIGTFYYPKATILITAGFLIHGRHARMTESSSELAESGWELHSILAERASWRLCVWGEARPASETGWTGMPGC